MKKNILIVLAGLLVVSLFFSCEPEKVLTDALATQDVTENINASTVWKSDKVYVIKTDLYVYSNLTIEAGTIVKFPTKNGGITISPSGKIIAEGSSSSPIVFTSYKDDKNGGDSDGVTANPAKGDWGTIKIMDGSNGSIFSYCEFNYGGSDNGIKYMPTLDLGISNTKVNNCSFYNNGGGYNEKNGSFAGALDAKDAKDAEIKNNSFNNNNLPLSINCEMNIDNTNKFSNSTMNAIFVDGIFIQENTKWQENEVAFVIVADNLTIGSGSTLTLAQGVVLKFLDNGRMSLLDGSSALIQHDAKDVFFTYFSDDDHGGDSDGNGLQTLTKEYYWDGIFTGGYKATNNYADWTNILYANPNPGPVK